MINHLMLDSILSTAPLEYKGYKLKYFSQDVASLDYICVVQKDSFLKQHRDEHGRLVISRVEPEKFSFMIKEYEFEQEDPFQVIKCRFQAEVDYYLKHKSTNSTEDDLISKSFIPSTPTDRLRRYVCSHCGTDLVTDRIGFTPKCENCGAQMTADFAYNVEDPAKVQPFYPPF